MAKFSERRAAKLEQPIGVGLLERVSWDDLRVFIVVARTLSFRKSAAALRTSSSTVVRRMERLEDAIGFRLFHRFPDGVSLTAEGRSVYATAQQMEHASHSLRARLDRDLTARGTVRCSVTEGLGTAWIMPHLARFNRSHPSTIVDLRCAMEIADVLRMETDVAIQLQQPDRADVKSLRLGRMHVCLFASRRYVETYGLPKTLAELRQHRIVHQHAPQVEEGGLQRILDLPTIEGVVAIRTNASTALACAIEFGIGIGPLPTYIAAIGTDLVPVDVGIRYHVDIWMTYHPDARSTPRVSVFIDWLKTLFDPKRYPWFGDAFIHPRELAKAHAPQVNSTLLNLPIVRAVR
ncbi:MAG TPA: LysR family transcriptional regulator [Paraburkholderia sp.]|nr:LysR family transcriptional regulator [Xanthobacteraceae bacterium]HXZ07329.1 LysR family transcriptional regulator [Paraburkholderia sp.]